MKIKQKMYIVKWFDREPAMQSYATKDEKYCVALGEVEVEAEFDMPSDIEIRDIKVASLKSESEKVKADAQVRLEKIEEDIQSLMAITA